MIILIKVILIVIVILHNLLGGDLNSVSGGYVIKFLSQN